VIFVVALFANAFSCRALLSIMSWPYATFDLLEAVPLLQSDWAISVQKDWHF